MNPVDKTTQDETAAAVESVVQQPCPQWVRDVVQSFANRMRKASRIEQGFQSEVAHWQADGASQVLIEIEFYERHGKIREVG